MASSVHNPQISEPNSPLETLARQALRRYGDFVPGSVGGDTILMFLEFANLILDEVRAHPYYEDAYTKGLMTDLDYYTSQTDIRPLPDAIIIQGLLYHYAVQQMSQKAQTYMGQYARTMNQRLLGILRGHGPITLEVMDGGSRGGRS